MAGLFNTAMCLRRTLDFQASDKDVWAIYYKSLTWFKAIFGGIPFPNHHLGWPTGGKGRYKLPRYIFWGSHPIMIPSLLLLRFSKWPDFWDGLFVQVDLNSRNWPNLFSDWLKQCVVCVCVSPEIPMKHPFKSPNIPPKSRNLPRLLVLKIQILHRLFDLKVAEIIGSSHEIWTGLFCGTKPKKKQGWSTNN